MASITTSRAGAALLAATGFIHAVLVPEYLREEAYIGVLFILGAISCAALAVLLWVRGDALAWGAGAAVCAGMGVGFVLSRTVGLPGFHESEWDLSGMVSLALEGAFIALAASTVAGSRKLVGPGNAQA